MGPTSGAPLPARAATGKAVSEMARGERSAHPPARRDGGQRLEDEAAVFEAVVGDCQPARPETSAAPQTDVEIENARRPMLSAPPPEVAFDGLQPAQHRGRLEAAFDQRDRIGEIAPGAANGGIEHDRRGVE